MEEASQIKLKKKNRIDMLNGPFWPNIARFAIPMACNSLMQMTFVSADQAVAGRYVGKLALAAVGANSSLQNLILGLFVGLAVGSNSIIARYIGQKNSDGARKAIHTSIVFAFFSGIFLGVTTFLLARTIHGWMGTPDDVIDAAVRYIRFIACGMPFNLLYNYCSAILRSKGDTKRPLIVVTCTGFLNVMLNIFFVTVFHMGVEGVALATIIGQLINSTTLLILLFKEEDIFKISMKEMSIDFHELRMICSIGIPSGINGTIMSISNVLLQSSINKLGSNVMSAGATAGNFEGYIYYIFNAFCAACLAFVSQNYGAGNIKRVRQATKVSYVFGMIVTLSLSAICVVFRHQLPTIFVKDQAVIDIAARRILTNVSFEFLNFTMNFFSFPLRGLGKSVPPMFISLIGSCGLRIIWIYTVFPRYMTYLTLSVIYPISWCLTSIPLIIMYFKTVKSYEKKFAGKAA